MLTMDEDCEFDIAQSASTVTEGPEIRTLHANLIADAHQKFPTREALEDSIRERQAEIKAAVDSGFDVDEQTRARAELANDEMRKLLPLRMILHTGTDLTEMIGALQVYKEGAIRSLDMKKARNIQSEMDELQDQINKEEQYLLVKSMGETKCVGCGKIFPTEKKMVGILKLKENHCEECRDVASDKQSSVTEDIVAVGVDSSRDDEDNNPAESSISIDKQPELDLDGSVACGIKSMFEQSWW